jgi:hypothetical protein
LYYYNFESISQIYGQISSFAMAWQQSSHWFFERYQQWSVFCIMKRNHYAYFALLSISHNNENYNDKNKLMICSKYEHKKHKKITSKNKKDKIKNK